MGEPSGDSETTGTLISAPDSSQAGGIVSDQPPAPQTDDSRRGLGDWVEIYAAALLAIATILSAWSAYQATQWGGVQSQEFGQASTARLESSKEFNLALQLIAIDVNMFSNWAEAVSMEDAELEAFYREHLIREEFLPVLDDWIEQNSQENSEAAKNPFQNEEYISELLAVTEELEATASAEFAEGEVANQNGDDYILTTVIFASVLFFAGVGSKFRPLYIRIGLLTFGTAIFLFGLVRLLTFPVQLT